MTHTTVTLTPDFIKVRSNKKEVKFKIANDKAIELMIKWGMPMNTWRLFDTMDKEDKKWVLFESMRVLDGRNKLNQLLIDELSQI
jgi:hypothetical protein